MYVIHPELIGVNICRFIKLSSYLVYNGSEQTTVYCTNLQVLVSIASPNVNGTPVTLKVYQNRSHSSFLLIYDVTCCSCHLSALPKITKDANGWKGVPWPRSSS